MAVTRPKPSMLEDLKTLGVDIYGFVDDKKNRKYLIELIRSTKNVSNWTYYLNRSYFVKRFKEVDKCLEELESIYGADQYSKDPSHLYNVAWLKALLEFFNDELMDKPFRPGVKVLTDILQKFEKFDREQGIPLGYPMHVLLLQFKAKTEVQIKEYKYKSIIEETQKLKNDRAKIKGIQPEEEEKPIKRSYNAPERKKLGPEFADIIRLTTEIYRHPKLHIDIKEEKKTDMTAKAVEEKLGPPPTEPPPLPPTLSSFKKDEIKVTKILPPNISFLLLEEIRSHKRFHETAHTLNECDVKISP